METRPNINGQLSSLDKALETSSFLLIIILWGLTLFAWFRLPAIIPIHFNAAGHPDHYGSKTTLIFEPVLGTLLYWGLTALNKHPQLFKYSTSIKKINTDLQYTYATRMIRFLKLAILVIFTLAVLFTYLTTIGRSNGPGPWSIPLVFGLTGIPTLYYIIRSLKAK